MEDERLHLEQYYEQMKQSILENSNYIEALLGNSGSFVYSEPDTGSSGTDISS